MSTLKSSCRNLIRGIAIVSIVANVGLSAWGQAPAEYGANSSPTAPALRDELNQGVAAYKNAHYDDAIAHFRRAVELDPQSDTMAKAYLATALAQTVIPGLDTPENLRTAQVAVGVFQEVLEMNPHDVNSMKQIAGIYFSVKRLEDAKTWQLKVLAQAPDDAEAAYTIGVIDWSLAHQNALKALTPAGVMDDGEGNIKAPPNVLSAIKAQNGPLVEEALKYLSQALASRPDYDDAMAYMNLVYRRKADVDWDNEPARADDVAEANAWTRKAMDTRQANEIKRAGGTKENN